ncbi:hypothetical protein [Nocardia sp. NBC_00511]|uniref:hypothetical protein n=1 Tax=Nocardia sp. NBC_00511 TaxID=2903591 RepID=UPI0030E08C13
MPGYGGAVGYPMHPVPRKPKRRNMLWVFGGLTIAAVVAVVGVVVARGYDPEDTRMYKSVRDLRVGDCIDMPIDSSTLPGGTSRSCKKPHDAEVLYIGGIDVSLGDTAAKDDSAKRCDDHAAPLLAAAGLGDKAELTSYYSTDQSTLKSWSGIICLAIGTSGHKLTAPIIGN